MHWGTCSAQTPTDKNSCKDSECAPQTDSHSAYDIFFTPQSSDGLGRRISGKAPGGGFARKHDRRARTANSLASWTDKGALKKICTNSHKKRKGGGSANAPHCARSASDRAPFLQMLRMRLELLIGADRRQLAKARLFAPFAVVVAVLAPEPRLFAPFGQLNLFL